jgi:ferrochelatase
LTIAVLVMAYGGPRSLDEVAPYYTDIRGGRPPSAEALAELLERYRRIGGKSPLPEITQRQAEGLQIALDNKEPGRFKAYLGMKHWHPFIGEAVDKMSSEDVERVIGLVLAPHYSKMSIGGYEERLLKAGAAVDAGFDVRMIRSWYDDPLFVEFVAENVRRTLGSWSAASARVFFTAHSLPERAAAEGDPYRDQLVESSKLVADAARVPNWEFAFQSASETGEPWLGPDILDRLEAFAAEGGTHALIAPIGFVADHLEVLYDVDIECAEAAKKQGLEFRRISSPNDHPRFIEALSGIVLRNALV